MERRKQNWGTLVYTLKSGSRRNPLFRSSPNLRTSSRTLLDDDDDYGFIAKSPPPIPPPPIPSIPLEFQDEYQKRLKEHQNKVYWDSIKQKLTDYYSHHHESQRLERMSGTRGSSGYVNNRSMETASAVAKRATVPASCASIAAPAIGTVPAPPFTVIMPRSSCSIASATPQATPSRAARSRPSPSPASAPTTTRPAS